MLFPPTFSLEFVLALVVHLTISLFLLYMPIPNFEDTNQRCGFSVPLQREVDTAIPMKYIYISYAERPKKKSTIRGCSNLARSWSFL